MKSLSTIALSLSLLTNIPNYSSEEHTVLFQEMTEEDLLDLLQDPSSTIIKIDEGTNLPIKLTINSPVIAFESASPLGTLIVKEPFYVKMETFEGFSHEALEEAADLSIDSLKEFLMKNTQLLFSLDQITWKNFESFLGGNLQANIFVEEDSKQPMAEFLFDLYFKP
ncbi:MAG: hypothetical protein WCG10_04010 [Chlamydiota bacterium]